METLKKQAAKLLGEQKKYRRWLAVFLCLAMVVTAGTTAALKMNGQALSHEKKVLACSEEVHVHTAECYESGIIPVLVEGENALDREQPVCGYADYVVHAHGDGCFDEDGTLVCQLPEREPHIHTADCFEKQMVLVCGQEETEIHQHTEGCRELVCSQKEAEGHQHTEGCRGLICSQEETEGHQHTDACRELMCGKEETEGHQHTDDCRTVTQGELICENKEEGHEHTAECYEKVETITCGQEETEGHTHSEKCYGDYNCGMEETEGHTHSEECYGDYNCGMEEAEGHTHTEECYGPYTCGFGGENEGHVHTDECYQVKEVAICGELELHTHITEATDSQPSCYDAEGNLICGIPELKEHVHGEECFEIIQVEDEDSTKLYQKVYEDANVRVTAEYMADANIPEEAELVAERVDASAGSAEENTAESMETGTEGLDESTEASTESADESTEPAGEINEVAEVHEPEAGESEADAQEADTIGSNADVQAAEGSEAGSEASEAQADDAVADGSQDVSAAEDASAAKTEIEIIEEKVTYRLKFLVDGTEIEPEGTVSFIVQGLDGEGNETGDLVTLVYKAGDGLDAMTVTLALTKEISKVAEGQSGNQSFQKIYEDAEIRVTAEYAEDANIPENAELVAEKLETDTEAADESGETAADDNAQEPVEDGSDADVQEAESGELNETVEDNESDEAVSEDGEETAQENSADNEEDAASVKTVKKEVSYRLKFLADGVEVEPEGTVTFTAQLLDGNGNSIGQLRELIFNAGDGLDTMVMTLVRETIAEVANEFRQECETDTVRVIAQYGSEAELPENAVFKVENIAKGSEEYLKYEKQFKEELGDEDAKVGLALMIGFYVDDVEVEPKAPVSITVQMLDGQYGAGEELDVIHFGKEETEKLDASNIETDQEGNQTTSFEMSSFSAIFFAEPKEEDAVNFFVNLNGQIATSTVVQNEGDFSKSVKSGAYVIGASYQDNYRKEGKNFQVVTTSYESEVYGRNNKDELSYVTRKVLVAKDSTNAMRIDGLIRKLGTEGVEVPGEVEAIYGGYQGDATTYYISGFPSDEEVFTFLKDSTNRKDKNITISYLDNDGKSITEIVKPSDLNTDDFAVRWYSFHFNSGDKWHVDGVLVKKAAKIKITKTFSGDEDAIAAIKNGGYSITARVDGNEAISTETLRLTDKDVKISGNGNIYEWDINAIADVEYIIEEHNYISARSNIATIATYSVTDPTDKTYKQEGSYDNNTVKVIPKSYKSDEVATKARRVELTNNYVPQNTIQISKKDDTTGNPLVGVEFSLMKRGENEGANGENVKVNIWQVGTDYYLYNPGSSAPGAVELADGANIVTGENGMLNIIYSKDNQGSYTLTEVKCPEDGTKPMYKKVTVSFGISAVTDGSNGAGKVEFEPEQLPEGVTITDDGSSCVFEIRNKPETKNIAVRKEWAVGTPEDEKVPVKVQLFRKTTNADGTEELTLIPVDGSNEIVLNDDIDPDKSWKKEGITVPAYVDGQKAIYSIQETQIGETVKQDTVTDDFGKDTDGYLFYKVEYEEDAQGNWTVTNTLDGGTLTFDKIDKDTKVGLKGVTFTLYRTYADAKEGNNPVDSATSSENGQVSFENLIRESYYMKETVPEGYEDPKAIYVVEIGESKTGVIYLTDSNGVKSGDSISQITNELKRLDIHVRKVGGENGEASTSLNGAQFVLSKKVIEDNKEVTEYVSSVNEGIATWEAVEEENAHVFEYGEGSLANLEVGTYFLTEIKAPNGYQKLVEPIEFKVSLKNDDLELSIADPASGAKTDGTNTIVVSNATGYALPETGGPGTTMYTLGGFAVIAASLMYGLGMRRKKEKGGSH